MSRKRFSSQPTPTDPSPLLLLQLSTVVKHYDVPRVMESYARIMKISMDGLKKVKKVKSKAKAAQG